MLGKNGRGEALSLEGLSWDEKRQVNTAAAVMAARREGEKLQIHSILLGLIVCLHYTVRLCSQTQGDGYDWRSLVSLGCKSNLHIVRQGKCS